MRRLARRPGATLGCDCRQRAATACGPRLARDFARDLGAAGCCIAWGLVLGIDAEVHEGALAAGAPTVGILGRGHGRFFPRHNVGLAKRMIASQGAVLSPFPPARPALPGQFLERNGIVVSLSDAVVVIEAPQRSGALNTATWAAGRIPVLAVPADVDRRHVAGCHTLIRGGAILARYAADVLEALHIQRPALPLEEASRTASAAGTLGIALLAMLGSGERDLDTLVAGCGETASSVLSALTVLELEGAVERTDAAQYARVR